MSTIFERISGATWTRETAGQYSLGTPFRVTFDGEITHLRWYRQTTSGDAPSALEVWRASDQAIVATAASVTDGGTVGWKDCPITGGWRPDLNAEYRVAARNPASSGLGVAVITSGWTVPNGLALAQSGRAYSSAPPYVYPNTIEPQVYNAVDVLYVPDSPPPDPATPSDVDASLAEWLSSDGATQAHEADGLPWQTHAEVTSGTHGLSVLGELIGDVLEDTVALLARVPATLPATLTTIKDAVTIGPLPGIVGLETLGNNILAALEAAAQFLQNPDAGPLGALANNPPLPGAGWLKMAEVTFENAKSWDEPADLYVLNVTSVTPTRPTTLVDGAPWTPRLGWWCCRNGDAFGGRAYIDFPVMHLQDGGRRMAGIVVWLEPPSEATLEAWVLT